LIVFGTSIALEEIHEIPFNLEQGLRIAELAVAVRFHYMLAAVVFGAVLATADAAN
jgi:hypothetical protein